MPASVELGMDCTSTSTWSYMGVSLSTGTELQRGGERMRRHATPTAGRAVGEKQEQRATRPTSSSAEWADRMDQSLTTSRALTESGVFSD